MCNLFHQIKLEKLGTKNYYVDAKFSVIFLSTLYLNCQDYHDFTVSSKGFG